MHRRPSVLSHRPKTSSAADTATQLPPFEPPFSMKRTASQTFHPHAQDPRDAAVPAALGSVKEGMDVVGYPPSHHSYSSSSLSRASQVANKIRRRFSSSSSRRPTLSSSLDAPVSLSSTHRTTTTSTTTTSDLPHHFLQHHDSGILPGQLEPPASESSSRFSTLKRLSSFRTRRPATSGPSGEYAKFNPGPAPLPAGYLVPPPGHAARAAAAAANNERLQRMELGHGTRHANLSSLSVDGENVLKDTESGVGLVCSSPVDSQEKKFGTLNSRRG